eukprot:m.15749 g.15749  ORF g.15749 m.15749 type:complete len:65 (-) comp7909_c0_seq1:458-652(-)
MQQHLELYLACASGCWSGFEEQQNKPSKPTGSDQRNNSFLVADFPQPPTCDIIKEKNPSALAGN